jgi:hypothetical protein
VHVDQRTGLGWAGGYVGSGLTTTNLAGRTLRDLVLGDDTELTRLPWTGRQVRRWEPEPLRWLGVHGMYAAFHAADRREAGGALGTSRIAKVAGRLVGPLADPWRPRPAPGSGDLLGAVLAADTPACRLRAQQSGDQPRAPQPQPQPQPQPSSPRAGPRRGSARRAASAR